MWNGFNTTVIL